MCPSSLSYADYPIGSLRIRLHLSGRVELVRFDGKEWKTAKNNDFPPLQHELQDAVWKLKPGLYVPSPTIGTDGRF